MSASGYLQLLAYGVILLALVKPLGAYMARIFDGQPTFLNRIAAPLEGFLYRLCGVDPAREMRWTQYAIALLVFNLLGAITLYALQRLQSFLPFNPQGFAEVPQDLAFNTAAGFITTADWQSYAGEATLSYFVQMAGLSVQNFMAAASGMAVLLPLVRGFARQNADMVGNFWVDLTRGTLYILLPLSMILALALVSQGVVQTFAGYRSVPLAESIEYDSPKLDAQGQPIKDAQGNPVTERAIYKEQALAVGPAASQVAIMELGSNGGGFFNANSAHPYENPTPLSNFLELLAILLIPAALCYTFGKMVGDTRQGWAILAAMTLVFAVLLVVCVAAEQAGNPALARLRVDQVPSLLQPGGNMEGKETRFGTVSSTLWATATTASGNGSVNSMLDSLTPIGGLVPMALIQLGEVIFGGVGSGLYGMLVFAIVTVFVAGLMIGRTPEYLGKTVEAFEMKMASIAVLVPSAVALLATAVAVSVEPGRVGVANPGAHGFSEILYAFCSGANNNGSAFAGLSTNTPFYNTTLGLVILIGRFWVAVPVLALAGSLAAKKKRAVTAGTLPTHTPLFIAALIGTVLIIGGLTFFPALALGPIVEHLSLFRAG
jgi:K+-transporting ATPase ATPase A chain